MIERDKGSVERGLLPVIHADVGDDPHLSRVLELNQVIKHNYHYDAPQMVSCALPGCDVRFELTLIPHQVLYPKFCPRHRSAYQRWLHRRRK